MKAKNIFMILGILAVLFIIFTVAAVIYTERPEFCTTCHMMQPYYDSWKNSVHNKENCIECHYEPSLKAHVLGKINGLLEVAKYLTGKYTMKPSAKVSDITCLRGGCHTKDAVMAKKPLFKNKVEFDHSRHFADLRAGIKLRCTTCHAQLTTDTHIEVNKSACYICHFKNIPAESLIPECLKCHKDIPETGAHKEYLASGSICIDCHNDVKKGDGNVTKQACLFCHGEKEKIARIKEKEVLHRAHIYENKHKVECISCHNFIEHY